MQGQTDWIERRLLGPVRERLEQFPAVALLGPRQIGKTSLALELGRLMPSVYLDLEAAADRAKLADPALYLSALGDRLVILDEVQRMPELFAALRGLIDAGRRQGQRSGRFLLLGSASVELIRQASESLAGRIAYLELAGLSVLEVNGNHIESLWIRGGFPDSFLAASDQASALWRENFIRTYLERDVPQLGSRIPAETLRRFWVMLAHHQGSLLNAAELGRSLGVDGKTIARYLDLLVDLLLVRRLQPLHTNVAKRLVKSAKVFVRDSGLLHSLLGLDDRDAVYGHPVVGGSWEGFVVETLLSVAPERCQAWFYRTAAGAEMDLVLDLPSGQRWGVEVKRGLAPKLGKGFHQARVDLAPDRTFVVIPAEERYPLGDGVEAIGVAKLAGLLS
jgi:predicted AAA+ superfamily ATPase